MQLQEQLPLCQPRGGVTGYHDLRNAHLCSPLRTSNVSPRPSALVVSVRCATVSLPQPTPPIISLWRILGEPLWAPTAISTLLEPSVAPPALHLSLR